LSEPLDKGESQTGRELDDPRRSHPLALLPRLVFGALEDLRTIAQSVTVLPEVARSLASIQTRVDSLDDEVRRMRQAVDSIEGEVGEVRDAVGPLEREMRNMHAALHPLRRFGSAVRRGRGVPPGEGT
jgi:chromosome segregation ATPase